MWNYEKKTPIPGENHPDKPENRPSHYLPVRWSGRRAGRFHALSRPAVHHALQGSDRNTDRYRHRRTGSPRDGMRHRLPAHKRLIPRGDRALWFLRLTTWTTLSRSGPKRPAELRGALPLSSQRAIPSQISTKIWPRNRKPAQPMTIS